MPVNLNSSVCFFPDGTTDGSALQFVPCDPLAPVSACCVYGTSCLPGGLCLKEGAVMRGACTDKTWFSSECPTVCKATEDGKMKGPQNSYAWLSRCNYAVALDEFAWVCGLPATLSAKCTPDNSFPLQLSNPTFVDITGLAADAASMPPAAPSVPTSSASTTSCSVEKAPGVSATVVGAGVGVPLILLLAVALASTFWYRRKWKTLRDKGVQSFQSFQSTAPSHGGERIVWPKELAEKKKYPAQLDHIQPAVYEIGEHRNG